LKPRASAATGLSFARVSDLLNGFYEGAIVALLGELLSL